MTSFLRILFPILLLAAFALPRASAGILDLAEWSLENTVPGSIGVDDSAFDYVTGLGSISISSGAMTAGSKYIGLYLDHEIDEQINTFSNEYALAKGTLPARLSWEIDEPGWVYGDIYTNLQAHALDNSNGVPSSAPDDVSMALAWKFNAAAGDKAWIKFTVSPNAPASGFYLQQTDPNSNTDIYFTTDLRLEPASTAPEPEAVILLMIMGAAIAFTRRLWTAPGL